MINSRQQNIVLIKPKKPFTLLIRLRFVEDIKIPLEDPLVELALNPSSILKIDENENIVINFLDKQMNEFVNVSEKRSISGSLGGLAKAKHLPKIVLGSSDGES
jgi:hypothetical protein